MSLGLMAVTIVALAVGAIGGLLLGRLVDGFVRRRNGAAGSLLTDRAALELLVRRRTEAPSELASYLQARAEREKSALARELHDELGGALIAARMDVSWLADRMASSNPEVETRFKRALDTLQSCVNLKRRVVEDLRPSLLDNLGLIAALRWEVAHLCGRAGIEYAERYPAQELRLTPEASIALFRIVQEAVTNVVRHARARNVLVTVEVSGDSLSVRVRDDGVGLPGDGAGQTHFHGLAGMRQRALSLGGGWRLARVDEGGTEIEVTLPLTPVVAAPAVVQAS
jgi:signal transduction histidine kinase